MSENRHEPQCKKTTKDETKSNFFVLYIYATSGSGISTGVTYANNIPSSSLWVLLKMLSNLDYLKLYF